MNVNANETHSNNILILSLDRNQKLSLVNQQECKRIPKLELIPRQWIAESVNRLGEESAKAQELLQPITTWVKFTSLASTNDTILIVFNHDVNNSQMKAIDFYTEPKRQGYGKILFDSMLKQITTHESNHIGPHSLAYDRPSKSMISFLQKHYSLKDPLWQHNHFVIFNGIFN
ncbi:Alpha-tubulin N-acetyltransferase 1 [Blomia tropicalis]|nr:Alpha-tubulin N-acetyltransferase 1 [Blomia tropicalis]